MGLATEAICPYGVQWNTGIEQLFLHGNRNEHPLITQLINA